MKDLSFADKCDHQGVDNVTAEMVMAGIDHLTNSGFYDVTGILGRDVGVEYSDIHETAVERIKT